VYALAGFWSGELELFTSLDGVSWRQEESALGEFGEFGEFAECGVAELTGGSDALILIADHDCGGAWLGRL
jgi:hypothetical protein